MNSNKRRIEQSALYRVKLSYIITGGVGGAGADRQSFRWTTNVLNTIKGTIHENMEKNSLTIFLSRKKKKIPGVARKSLHSNYIPIYFV